MLAKLLILVKQIALMPSFFANFKILEYFLENLTSKQPFAVIYFNRHLAKTYVYTTYTNFNINVGISDVVFFDDQKPQKDFSRYFNDFKHQRKLYNYVDH